VLLYEIHDSQRFPRVQACVSYCRLINCAKASAGKRYGSAGKKLGNADLKWAFSEAAALFLRHNPAGPKYLTRFAKQHGQGKALTVLTHKLARAVYDRWQRDIADDRATGCVPPLSRTWHSRANGSRSASSLTRTVRGHRYVSRPQSPHHGGSAIAVSMARAPLYVCGADTYQLRLQWKSSQDTRPDASIAKIKKAEKILLTGSVCLLTSRAS
jgi:hypothetical protein